MNTQLFPATDVDDHNNLNKEPQSQSVAGVEGAFSMSNSNRGSMERAPHIQFLGVC